MTKSFRPILTLAAGAAAAAILLSGCAGTSDETAETERVDSVDTLTVYSGRDEELVAPLIEQFEEASGIDVEVRYAGSAELAALLLEEGENSAAQVFLSQDSGSLGTVSDAGLLEQLDPKTRSAVPAEFTSTDGTWVGITGRARVVAFDSEKYSVGDVPGDVFELLAPQWQGKVGIAPSNASFQAFVTALRVSEGEDRAREWLDGLVANDAQIFERNSDLLEAVNSGVLDLALTNHYYWARSEQDPATLRAQLKFGDPGSASALINVTGAGVLASEATEEAHEFVRFLVSEEAQTYFVEQTFEYPLVDGVGQPDSVPAVSELGAPDIDLAELSSQQETVALITEVGLL